MGREEKGRCPRSCEGFRVRICCRVDSRSLQSGLVGLGEVEEVEKEERLVEGGCIRVRSHGRVGGVHGVPIRCKRESGDDDSRQVVCGNFFNEEWVGRSPPLYHFRIKAVKGLKGVHGAWATSDSEEAAVGGEAERIEGAAKKWGIAGRGVLTGLALP